MAQHTAPSDVQFAIDCLRTGGDTLKDHRTMVEDVLGQQLVRPHPGDPLLSAALDCHERVPMTSDLPFAAFNEGLRPLSDEELRALLFNPEGLQQLRQLLMPNWHGFWLSAAGIPVSGQ